MNKIFFIIIATLISASTMFAGGTYEFLRNDVSARAAALGGNFVTVKDDPNSLFYNPAGLASIQSQRVSIGFFKNLLEVNSGHASFATNIPSFGTVGAGMVYTNYGSFDNTDDNGQILGTFNAGDFAFTGGYADKLTNGLEYGVNVKFIFSSIADYASSAAAIDVGARYEITPNGFTLGASILNIGTQFEPYMNTREDLPLDVRVGASFSPEHLPAVVMVGFSKLNEQQDKFFDRFSSFMVGVEFTASESVSLRFGYNNEKRRELKLGSSSGLAGFSLGAGFRTEMYTIDYAFNSMGKIGGLHRVSLGLSF